MTDDGEVMTLAEFARHIRRSDAWVSMLKSAGRLVLTEAGKVRVRESLELIEATAAGNAGAADRHEAERQRKAAAAAAPATDEPAQLRREVAGAALRLRKAQADREEMERDRLAGRLIDREEAGYAMRDLGTFVRQQLELMPEQAAPLIAERLGVGAERIDDLVEVLTAECTAALERIAARLREAQQGDGK